MSWKRGVTVIEMLIVVGLVALLYSLMMVVTVQIAQATRRGTTAAQQRLEFMKVCERLRWQLRSLYKPPKLPETDKDRRPIRSGILGTPDLALLGQRGQSEGRDVLLFLTSDPVGMRGVAEVGYQLRVPEKGRSELVYRQFPVRYAEGLHTVQDFQEAPWTPIAKGVTRLTLDYTKDNVLWQREWDEDDEDVPRRIRVHIETDWKETIDFQVTPGMGAGRW